MASSATAHRASGRPPTRTPLRSNRRSSALRASTGRLRRTIRRPTRNRGDPTRSADPPFPVVVADRAVSESALPAEEVVGPDEGADAGVGGGGLVPVGVADVGGRGKVHVVKRRKLEEHAGPGLATAAAVVVVG